MSFPTPRLRVSFVASLLAFCLTALLAHAGETPAGVLAFRAIPPAKFAPADIQAALLKASMGRGWAVTEKTDGKVVIHLKLHKHEATVTYLISADKVEAYCEGYKLDDNGNHKEAEQPKGWLKYLREDITKQFGPASVTAL